MKTITNKTTLFIIVSVLLFAGFFVTNFISYQVAKNTLRDNIINTSLPLTRDNIYSEIQRDIMLPVYVASLMSNDTFLRDWVLKGESDVGVVTKYLDEIKNKYGFFASFFISEKTKKYYYYNGLLKTVSEADSHDVWYYRFKSLHVPYELTIDTNQAAGNALTIFINHRVYDYDNNLIGVTGVGLSLERITNLLSAYRVKYNRNIYLIDKHGLVKAHHDPKLVEVANIKLMDGIKDFADEILTVGQQPMNFEYDRAQTHILLTSRYIPELDWFLIVEQNQNKAIENIWYNFIKSSLLGILVSAAILFIIISSINYYNRRLEKLAVTDDLTGSYNRREFSRIFDKAVHWHKKTGGAFSTMLVDIDNFKTFNDSEGHLKGDEVIKAVTNVCRRSIRDKDLIARWGGDEFILLIYGGKDAAVSIADRINDSLAKDERFESTRSSAQRVTISMGITEYIQGDTEDSITIRADKALYKAKESGRNRYEVAEL